MREYCCSSSPQRCSRLSCSASHRLFRRRGSTSTTAFVRAADEVCWRTIEPVTQFAGGRSDRRSVRPHHGSRILFRSFVALTEVDLGFRSEKLLVMYTSVPAKTREDHIRATARLRDLIADCAMYRALETRRESWARPRPVQLNGTYRIEGRPAPKSMVDGPNAWFRLVDPGVLSHPWCTSAAWTGLR